MPDASVAPTNDATGMIRHHQIWSAPPYDGSVSKQSKKQQIAASDALVKRLVAKKKQSDLLREVFPGHVVDDPRERQRILRGNRRNARWNEAKNRG